MDIGRAVSYIHQVAVGLDYAFRNGIIHRDIKPGNVLIDRKGMARILDMGLARFFNDHGDQLTLKYDDKIVLGTADYVAPEQVANSHAVDIRADIYALGATLYFLLAGHPPFPTGTVSQKLLWHRTKEPTPIRQVRPEVPEGLAAILARMMAKDPKARYQTPAQVISQLESLLPSSIPLPRSEEMPKLSPAATRGADEGVDLGNGKRAVADQRYRTANAGFAARRRISRRSRKTHFDAPGVSALSDVSHAIALGRNNPSTTRRRRRSLCSQQTQSRPRVETAASTNFTQHPVGDSRHDRHRGADRDRCLGLKCNNAFITLQRAADRSGGDGGDHASR